MKYIYTFLILFISLSVFAQNMSMEETEQWLNYRQSMPIKEKQELYKFSGSSKAYFTRTTDGRYLCLDKYSDAVETYNPEGISIDLLENYGEQVVLFKYAQNDVVWPYEAYFYMNSLYWVDRSYNQTTIVEYSPSYLDYAIPLYLYPLDRFGVTIKKHWMFIENNQLMEYQDIKNPIEGSLNGIMSMASVSQKDIKAAYIESYPYLTTESYEVEKCLVMFINGEPRVFKQYDTFSNSKLIEVCPTPYFDYVVTFDQKEKTIDEIKKFLDEPVEEILLKSQSSNIINFKN